MEFSVQELMNFNQNDNETNIFYLSNSYTDQITLLDYILKYLDYCVNSKRSHSFKPEKTCVFLDIDGTILYTKEENNQPPSNSSSSSSSNQTKNQLKKYYKSITQCTTLLFKIFEKCNQLGILVFLITARTDTPEVRDYTKKQLESCGYYDVQDLYQKSISNKQSHQIQQTLKGFMKEQQKIFQQHHHIKTKKPFYQQLFMLPVKIYQQLSNSNDFNFSTYKFNTRQYIIARYKVVPLLCIGDQWYDVIHIPSNWNKTGRQQQEQKNKQKQILHFIHTKIMPSLNGQNQIYIMTGIDISWLSVKLSMSGIK